MHVNYSDNPITAELYDLVPGYINRADKDFYVRCAVAAGGSILELGCGTGRILLPIAQQGCQITGLDLSTHMLSKCRQKLKSIGIDSDDHVRLIQGDMTGFKLDSTFRLTIIPFHAFQHLVGVDDQVGCLRSINRHLDMKGRLIFDIFHVDFKKINDPALLTEVEDLKEFELPDGRHLRRTHRIAVFHRAEQYNDVELIYYLIYPDGKTDRIVHAFPMRYFFRYEIEHLLERCGFRLIELYGNFDKSPLADDSPEMIFVAEKYEEI